MLADSITTRPLLESTAGFEARNVISPTWESRASMDDPCKPGKSGGAAGRVDDEPGAVLRVWSPQCTSALHPRAVRTISGQPRTGKQLHTGATALLREARVEMGPRQIQAIANRMEQVVHVVGYITAPPGVHARTPQVGVVASPEKPAYRTSATPAGGRCSPTRMSS